MESEFIIRQISIFSENKPGRLASVAKALQEEGINIFAFSIAEANGFGVIRAIVNRAEEAHKKLTELGFMVSFTDVIAVKMRDQPGGLYETAAMLGDAGINITYSYAYSGRDGAVLIIRVDEVEDAIRAIKEHGGELISNTLFK
jgi:hypothetical protein